MKAEFLRRLQRRRDILVKEIDTVGLWNRLYQHGVITRNHKDMCKSMSTPSEQLETLLDTLEKRDDSCFEKFCLVIRYNNPDLVACCLEQDATEKENMDGGESASLDDSSYMREMRNQAQNLEQQNEKLQRKVERLTKMRMWLEKDTENSLIQAEYERDKLKKIEEKMEARKYKIRNYELGSRKAQREKRETEIEQLRKEQRDLEEQLDLTIKDICILEMELEKLTKGNVDLKRELMAAKKTNADSIDLEHQSSPGASSLSLLLPQDLERFNRNQSFVMEACGDLNRRELVPMLHSLNCITRSQRNSLDESEDVQLLFDTIRSFSSANYDSFLVCLRKLNHTHIADVLDFGGVAIKLLVGIKLDEDARKRHPIDLLNNTSNRETIEKAFGCREIKFLRARLARPNEEKSIEIWVWCQTENSLKVLSGALASGTLLKQLVVAFEALGIRQSGLTGLFSSSGKPVSVTADQDQFKRNFCPCLPYGHIVRKVKRQMPESGRRSAITGLAFWNDRAYIVSSGSSSIQVFQSSAPKFDALPEIYVQDVRNPVDLCAGEGWLYILEREKECIWKVSALEASSEVVCFDGIVAHALSLTPDGHLLLTIRGARSFLLVCRTSDGKAIRDIALPSGMDAPWHGLGTGEGNFIVSHRRSNAHQVSKIQGLSGTPNVSYTGNSKLCQPLMDTPCHMTIDDEGQVFVADQKNRRVLLFDAELQVSRVLLMTEGGCPNRLSFNQDTGQLLVGLDNGVVEVYVVNEFKYHGTPEGIDEN